MIAWASLEHPGPRSTFALAAMSPKIAISSSTV